MKYPRLASMIFNTPLMVRQDALDMAVSWADNAMHLNIINLGNVPRLKAGDWHGEDDDGPRQSPQDSLLEAARKTGVYILPVHGPLVSRSAHVEMCTTMTSYEGVRNQLNAALTDPNVAHIVFDIDSPGGSAAGMADLCSEIYAARAIKPVTAIVNFAAYSAAYGIASACSNIIVSQSSGVGSIGVIAQHADFSRRLEEGGIKITTVYAGARKNDLSPNAPATEEALAWLTELVQTNYTAFTELVARNRGLSVDVVRATEAGVYHGQAAIAAGLADRIEAPQEAINRIVSEVAASRRSTIVQSISGRAAIMNVQNNA